MTMTQTEKVMKAVLKATEQALELRTKIRKAISDAEEQIPAAEQGVLNGLEQLSVAQAEAALNGTPDETAGVEAVNSARMRLQTLRARVAGLKARLTATDDDVLQADAAFREARRPWRDERVVSFEDEYQQAALRFAAVVRRGLALAAAMETTFSGLAEIRLPKVRDASQEIYRFRTSEIHNGERVAVSPWQGDADLEGLVESMAPLRACTKGLRSEVSDVQARRSKLAADEEAAKMAERQRSRGLGAMSATMFPIPEERAKRDAWLDELERTRRSEGPTVPEYVDKDGHRAQPPGGVHTTKI